MCTTMTRGVWVVTALSLASVATATQSDRRLVDAAAAQRMEAVRVLLEADVDVNTPQPDGATPLLWATHWDDLETAALLLRAGADPNAAEDHGVTPLALACENGSVAMVDTLLAAGAHAGAVQTNGLTPLMIAARTGNVDVVRTLLVHDAEVNAATAEATQTALMWSVAERHLDIVRVLIAAGADVRASSTRGFTPLLFAARNGDIDTASALLAAGARVNDLGSDGTHPLPLAVVSGQEEFARFLLERGADPNGTLYGVAALHAAAGPVDIWLREWLRARGIDGVLGSGLVGLRPAARLALVHTLLDHGANPNIRIEASTTVEGYLTTARGAFETYAIGTGDLRGATPLWVAAFAASRSGGADMIRTLLAGGADLTLRTDDQTSALMTVAGLGHLSYSPGRSRGYPSPSAEEAVQVLVEAGADVTAVNEANFTALHGAAYMGVNEVLEYLLDHGADIDGQDFRGRTAFRIAEGAKQSFQFQAWPDTAALLRDLGADTTLGAPGRVLERQLERDANQRR